MSEQLPDPSRPEQVQIAVDNLYLSEEKIDQADYIIAEANRALGRLGLRLVTNEETAFKVVNAEGKVTKTVWRFDSDEEVEGE